MDYLLAAAQVFFETRNSAPPTPEWVRRHEYTPLEAHLIAGSALGAAISPAAARRENNRIALHFHRFHGLVPYPALAALFETLRKHCEDVGADPSADPMPLHAYPLPEGVILHAPAHPPAVDLTCSRFLRTGHCAFGSRCRYLHTRPVADVAPQKMPLGTITNQPCMAAARTGVVGKPLAARPVWHAARAVSPKQDTDADCPPQPLAYINGRIAGMPVSLQHSH